VALGTSVSPVARRHDINAHQMFRWRTDTRRDRWTGCTFGGGERAARNEGSSWTASPATETGWAIAVAGYSGGSNAGG
jgi:hypothetical protein